MVKIVRITHHNVLGIEDIEVTPGKVTRITGKNAAGKSSFIKGMLSVVEGGKEATLVRNGEDTATSVIVLDTPDGAFTFRKRTTADGNGELKAYDANNVEQKAPQSLLNKYINGKAANPVKFLRGAEDEQLDWLLKATPMTVTAEQIGAALGRAHSYPVTGHALTVIDRIYNELFAQRTGFNTSHKDATKTALRLKAGLPPAEDDGKDFAAEARTKQGELDALRKSDADRRAAVATAKVESKAELDKHLTVFAAKVNTELETEIAKLREAAALKISTERASLAGIHDDIERESAEELAKIESEIRPQVDTLVADVATATAKASERGRSAANRKHYDDTVREAEEKKAESDRLTAELSGLQTLKSGLLTTMPIAGLEVKDGKIFHQGTILHQVNTAEQMKLAIKIAALSCKPGDPIVVDGLECFDPDNMAAFQKIAEKSPYQFFFSCVGTGPLKIEQLA